MLTRRSFIALAAAGLVAPQLARLAQAADPPPSLRRGSTDIVVRQATAGPPVLPDQIRVRLPDDTYQWVPFEEYVKGVVPNELPASWAFEALRAQAVAARTYGAAVYASKGYVWSDTRDQVWNPASRTQRSDDAVTSTAGQVLVYQGGLIVAKYSSTCGGQTVTSPDAAGAYLQGVRCWGPKTPLDLSSESAAASFWGSRPAAFCGGATYYRWAWTPTGDALSATIDAGLQNSSIRSFVSPSYSAGRLGQLQDLVVISRGVSGAITGLRIVGSGGTWTVSDSSFAVQVVLGSRTAKLTYALQKSGAKVSQVNGQGGGYGHGMGLCQWGAKGMADAGYGYDAIIQQYYSNVSIYVASTASTPTPTATPAPSYPVPTPPAGWMRGRLPWVGQNAPGVQ